MTRSLFVLIFLLAPGIRAEANPNGDFHTLILPFLEKHCLECHDEMTQEAELNLDRFESEISVLADRPTWKRVWEMLHAQEMPPLDKPQPPEGERLAVADWAEKILATPDAGGLPNPGHVPPRRLSATEYNNTIQDLLGMQRRSTFYDPARNDGMPFRVRYVMHRQFPPPVVNLPPDTVAHSFDNVAEALTLPPFLLEKYLSAAKSLTTMGDPRSSTRDARRGSPRDSPGAPGRPDYPRARFSQPGGDEAMLGQFLKSAFRRPVAEEEKERYLRLYRDALAQGASSAEAVAVAQQAILVAPSFLFRIETGIAEEEKGGVRPLGDHELASRLSYFLWSTLPDAELIRLADAGELRHPDVLEEQARRMILDPKAEEFCKRFPIQWLQLHNINSHAPDPGVFPPRESRLRYLNESLATEIFLNFGTLLAEDRSVLDLIEADYTWLNGSLCILYGIEPQASPEGETSTQLWWQRYPLPDRRRGGVLTSGAVLMTSSNPTGTNPVKRGKWILEVLLNTPPPPPLPDVPALDDIPAAAEGMSLREKLALHRSDAACAGCHSRMDPLGLALENYSAIGAWRDEEKGREIDSTSSLADGTVLSGPEGLKRVLATDKREFFVRSLTSHLLIYALGRPMDYFDIQVIGDIGDKVAADEYRISRLIVEIVKSYPFRYLNTSP